MKIKIAASCIVIGIALAPIVAEAADQDSSCKHPTTSVKGAIIAASIKAKLAEEKIDSLPNMTVDSDAKGEVLLCGRVKTEQEADTIIFFVHRVQGVTAVKSYFEIPGDK